jgi:DNA-binding transcriptional LysR family regulator
MDSTVLKTFIEAVEAGSLVAAAKRLNVTQSTVTARINSLEREIGQKLIHRNKSGTELTSAGFKLKRYAEAMLQMWSQARLEASLPKGFVNVCNLGCEVDLWLDVGQRLIEHLAGHGSEVALAAWPGDQRHIDRWLNIGLVDLALCYSPQPSANFSTTILFDDELVLVESVEAKLSGRDPGLPGAGYVYVDHGDEFRRQHVIAFPGDATPALSLASSDWALDHMARHGGSGYLPLRHVQDAIAMGQLRLIKNAPRFKRRVYAIANIQAARHWSWFDRAIALLRER